jgi:hypothetical protein
VRAALHAIAATVRKVYPSLAEGNRDAARYPLRLEASNGKDVSKIRVDGQAHLEIHRKLIAIKKSKSFEKALTGHKPAPSDADRLLLYSAAL